MPFDIGAGEFAALVVIAMIVLGPEKLPRYAAEAARFLQRMRAMASAARADVRRELGPEFDNLSIADLNPRTMVRRHLIDPIDIDSLGDDLREGPTRGKGTRNPGARGGAGTDKPATPGAAPPPYDPDAT